MPKALKLMYIKTPLKVLLYVGLLVGGLTFSLETIQEYLKGSTSHYSTSEPITLYDIPTLSICWLWRYDRDIYGKDFSLELCPHGASIGFFPVFSLYIALMLLVCMILVLHNYLY